MKFYQWCAALTAPVLLALSVQQTALAAPVELSVEESIALAMKNNHDLRYAQSAREKAYWSLKEAKGNKSFSIDYTNLS